MNIIDKIDLLLNEKSNKGWGISFVDIDETTFKTFSLIHVVKDGKIVRKLDNQEFNHYELKDGESYDFQEFRNAEIFNKTSIPIPQTVDRIKKMLSRIKETGSESKIIFLTARADFDNKNLFLSTFEKYGIKMDKPNVYVERSGNLSTGTIPERKKQIIMKYLKQGIYRRVRMLDDHEGNIKMFLEMAKNIPKEIEDKVRKTYQLSDNETPMQFFGLFVKPDGNLKLIKEL